jgi:hypothetical protein
MEAGMNSVRPALLLAVLSLASLSAAQVTRVIIPAGTPEDVALQAITDETDEAKKLELLKAFVSDFAQNPVAVAYGNSLLAQQLIASDAAQALAHADRAAEAAPNNIEVLLSLAAVAQQAKDQARVFKYAVLGAKAYNGIGKEQPPEGMSAEDFARRAEQERTSMRPWYDNLEGAAFGAIAAETDPKRRMDHIEAYGDAFPGGRYENEVSQYAVYTLQQLQDSGRLIDFGEKKLAAKPDDVPTLIMLAETYAEDAKRRNLPKAVEYARRAVTLSAPDASADGAQKLLAGSARSVLGTALLNQGKTDLAIAEYKIAAPLLKENPAAYSTVLYRLGWAHAKLLKYTEARAVLTEAAQVPGPAQQLARDLLVKVNAQRAKGQ